MSIVESLGAVSPAESVEYLNLLIYGKPGAGKTWLAGTAQDHPSTGPILVLDLEGGVTTLRHRPEIKVKQIRTMKQLEEAFNIISKENEGHFKTVVLDSLSELQKLDMQTVMKEQFDKKPESTDILVPSQREWGKSGERIRLVVRKFRDLPVHTIMTCHMAFNMDEKTKKTEFFPSLPGKLRSEIPGFFDVVGYLKTIETREGNEIIIKRVLQVVETEAVIAKDRTSSLGNLVLDPTIPNIWGLINSNGKGAKK